MPTDLVWGAVSLSFRLNRYLWKTPLQWNSSAKRFLHKPGGIRVYFWWYFVVFGIFIGLTCSCILVVIHGQIYHPKAHLPLANIVQYVMAYFAGFLAGGISLLITFFGKDIVFLLNRTIKLHEDLAITSVDKKRRKQRTLFRIPIPSLHDPQGNFDTAGLALFAILTPLPSIGYILVPITVLVVKTDVFRFILEDIVPPIWQANMFVNFGLILLRLGLMLILNLESLRIFPFLVFILGIPTQLVTRIADSFAKLRLDSGTPPYKWNTTLRHYTTLQLLSGSVEQGLAEVTFPLMGLGLLFSVALNFACIRFIHPGMNLGYYALYPFLSTVVWVLIWTLVPVAIGIHETTKSSLIGWRRELDIGDALLIKRLRAMRPLRFYAGVNGHYFYSLDKSVMSTYLMAILDYTVNLLVSVPNVNLTK